MATEKRDRQRANRAQKQAVEHKKRRRREAFDLIKRWAAIGVVIIVIFLAASFFLN